MSEVRVSLGVPSIEEFRRARGTPLVVDELTGNVYALIAGVVTLINNLQRVHAVRVERAAAVQSIPNATTTAVIWDTEVYDPYGLWVSSAPTRITLISAGVYMVRAYVAFASNVTGIRSLGLSTSGGVIGESNTMSAAVDNLGRVATMRIAYFNAGDYIEAWAHQTSGGALNLDNSAGVSGPMYCAVTRIAHGLV